MSLHSLMLICESILQEVRERAAGKQMEKTEKTLRCVRHCYVDWLVELASIHTERTTGYTRQTSNISDDS